MRFYQLEAKRAYLNPDLTCNEPIITLEPEWFGTERAAIIRRNVLFQTKQLIGLKRENLISPIDVPTDKAGLLRFLQDNVTDLVKVREFE